MYVLLLYTQFQNFFNQFFDKPTNFFVKPIQRSILKILFTRKIVSLPKILKTVGTIKVYYKKWGILFTKLKLDSKIVGQMVQKAIKK